MNEHQWYQPFPCQLHWEGVDANPRWHGVTERPHTPPLLKEVCLAGGNIDFTFTSIKESPEECGTPFDVPSKQAMWFVDEANPNMMHTSFNHGGYNVHLIHVDTW